VPVIGYSRFVIFFEDKAAKMAAVRTAGILPAFLGFGFFGCRTSQTSLKLWERFLSEAGEFRSFIFERNP